MGFLSSLFGYEDKPAVTSKVSTIPPELKPYVDEAMKDTQALYKQRMGEGYQAYAGDTIAGLTPEQIASQEGLKSLVGTQIPFQQEALGTFRQGAERFTPETAKQFMSPYQRAVIDQEKEQAQRQYERTKRPQFEADAVRAGGMSGLGSRAAIESAEREDLQARFLGDIETKGLQAAYKDAQAQFTDQKARERVMAGDVATAGGNIFSAGLAEQGLLKDIGAEKQGLAQSALDEAYFKYKKEQGFPEEQLGRYTSSIYGNPLLAQPNYTSTKTPEQASMGKSLIGLGLSGLKAYGGGSTFGGIGKAASGIKSFFGSPAASGGQVNRLAVGGSVLNPSDSKVTTFEEYNRAEREAQAAAGLQQEASPFLSTPASTVATAPAPAMASAAPTGLPAALAPAVMAQLPGGEDGGPLDRLNKVARLFHPAITPQLPGPEELKPYKAKPQAPMPSGFTHPTGPVTMALVPFWNPTTGEEWTAPSGGYIPPPGWETKDNELRADGTENQPMPRRDIELLPREKKEGIGYTYDKSRGGFKEGSGPLGEDYRLTIDPETSMYGWLDDDDGPYFDQQAFLADAYNTNISGGVQGRLGRGNFIEKTEDEDDEGGLSNTYRLARNAQIKPMPYVNPWPDLEAPWHTSVSGGLQSLNRRGGGRVMPPVMYRQTGGDLMGADVESQTGINRPPEDRIAALQAALAAQKTPAVAAPTVSPPPPKPTVDPNEPQRKSVAKNVAQIKGTAEDNLMAGLAAYLKPFGTPADILGAQTEAESKRNIAAAKEELKMTSEEEKATAKVKAAIAKAKGKNKSFKISDINKIYEVMSSQGLSGIQVGQAGEVVLEGEVFLGANPDMKGSVGDIQNKLNSVVAASITARDEGMSAGEISQGIAKQIAKIRKDHNLS